MDVGIVQLQTKSVDGSLPPARRAFGHRRASPTPPGWLLKAVIRPAEDPTRNELLIQLIPNR